MIRYFPDLIQGSDEWRAARCGLLTASEMHLIVTPTFRAASNDRERAHLYELLAQRITRYVEPAYISDDMLRGQTDEIDARALYARHYAPVETVGFVTNDEWGFTLGCSPDGLIGDDGLLECKSRRQKFQVETIVKREVPDEYVAQVQTALLVTGRKWCDFVSYSGGLPMVTVRVLPDPEKQAVIVSAAEAFEAKLAGMMDRYLETLAVWRTVPTERRIEEDMLV